MINSYRRSVSALSKEDRKSIFFLRINDEQFKPHVDPVGKSIVTDLYTKDLKDGHFTDVPLDDKDGYFIIAAPST